MANELMPNQVIFVERLACIQFERSDQRFKPARATNFLTNRLQDKSGVLSSCNRPTPAS